MEKNPVKIVVIGGGSGLSVVLRGLKHYTSDITAIVTVADDGGSSGDLREDLGMLPPGDIRNCIVALSNTEEIMESLMQYRFKDGKLKGQSLGNLLIAGLVDLTGSMEDALRHVHNIFAVTGRVLPVSNDDITLYAKLDNGLIVKGESKIPLMSLKYKTGIERVFIEPAHAKGLEESIHAILEADLVMLGPGSLYTSILPNLLIEDIQDALKRTTAKKVLVANLMTQPGETDHMDFMGHVEALLDHTHEDLMDCILINQATVPKEIEARYLREGARILTPTEEDLKRLLNMGFELVQECFTEVKAGYVRHDAHKLSETLINLIDTKSYIISKERHL